VRQFTDFAQLSENGDGKKLTIVTRFITRIAIGP